MPDLSLVAWLVLALGAVVIGLSKAALPGAGTVAVVLFASVLPAKESTGTILLLLIVGDAFALVSYRRHADWRTIVRMAPAVVLGLVAGAVFLVVATDALVRVTIGVLLLLVVAVTLWRRRSPSTVAAGAVTAGAYGGIAGFTTMVANAAGPVMSMYFIAARFPVQAFLGTSAWFFAVVNVAKLPFSFGLGLITPQGALTSLLLVPVVLAAAFVGRAFARRVDQRLFDRIVIVLTIIGSVTLLIPR